MSSRPDGRLFAVDDLPKFSPWPARLLGIEPWTTRRKTPESVTREYHVEKWGPLLERIRRAQGPVTLDQVDEWAFEGIPASLCYDHGRFELLTAAEAHTRYLDLVAAEVRRYGPPAALVELGAGYGSVILALARREPFAAVPIGAGEYTMAGVEMLRLIADATAQELQVGHCDFASRDVADFDLPAKAVIFTSFATPYVPTLKPTFVDALCGANPAVVIHFEPCVEHCDPKSLLGLMRRRYIEVNDYNTNLMTVLRDAQDAGKITIVDERQAVFGANPLLAASVIAWVPSV